MAALFLIDIVHGTFNIIPKTCIFEPFKLVKLNFQNGTLIKVCVIFHIYLNLIAFKILEVLGCLWKNKCGHPYGNGSFDKYVHCFVFFHKETKKTKISNRF